MVNGMRLINPFVGSNGENLRVQSCPSPVILYRVNDRANLQSSTREWILMRAGIYEKTADSDKLVDLEISYFYINKNK